MAATSVNTYNYGDIFFLLLCSRSYFVLSHVPQSHAAVYSFWKGGGEKDIWIGKGECAFVCRDTRLTLHKLPAGGDAFGTIFIHFTRRFLSTFSFSLDRRKIPYCAERFLQSVRKMACIPSIESLSLSMQPYFDTAFAMSPQFIDIKLQTAVHTLFQHDQRFYAVLFDFVEPWKIDIREFMENNYSYRLTIQEMADFTGRSLSTFRHDFRKLSQLPLKKWVTQRRFQEALEEKLRTREKCHTKCIRN